MKIKRNFIPFILIVTFLIITGRYLFFITYIVSQKSVFRSELIEQHFTNARTLEINSQDLFKDRNGLVWEENNKELIMNGTYYEVICVKQTGNRSFVTILEDCEETRLFFTFLSGNTGKTGFLTDFIKILSLFTFLDNPPLRFTNSITISKIFTLLHSFTCGDFHSQRLKPPGTFFS